MKYIDIKPQYIPMYVHTEHRVFNPYEPSTEPKKKLSYVVNPDDFPAGVTPKAILARAFDPKDKRYTLVRAVGIGLTKEEAFQTARRKFRLRAVEKAKKEKPVLTFGSDGYILKTKDGIRGYGQTLREAQANLLYNLEAVAEVYNRVMDEENKVPPPPPKKWSFWDWFR